MPPATWVRVSAATRAASEAARRLAEAYAEQAVGEWLARVRERTDTEFIPWLTGYWTQQWLALRLAWYRMNDAERDAAAATARLGEYLQGQFRARVLDPVAEQINPGRIRDQATARYVQALAEGIRALPDRYGVPQGQLERWLAGTPAIMASPGASLLDLIRSEDINRVAAYQALGSAVHAPADEAGGGRPGEALQGFAHRTADRLGPALALRGGTTAASVAGGLPGLLLGLGVTAWDASRHEQERPVIEAALRQDLDWALKGTHRDLLDDPQRGVLGAVTSIASQLEAVLVEGEVRGSGSATEVLW